MQSEKLYLNIADFIIGLEFLPSESPYGIETQYKDKIVEQYKWFLQPYKRKVDYWIKFIDKNNFEIIVDSKKRKKYIELVENEDDNSITTYYHLSDRQLQLLLRDIVQKLLSKNDGILLHASASLIGNKAYVFLGKSGAGKSTAIIHVSKKYPYITDDLAIIRKKYDRYYIYQPPFLDKYYWITKKHQRVPIKCIFFLKKAKYYKVEKIEKKENIIQQFIEQAFIEREDMNRQMKYLLEMTNKINDFYKLYFSLKEPKLLIVLLENIIRETDEKS